MLPAPYIRAIEAVLGEVNCVSFDMKWLGNVFAHPHGDTKYWWNRLVTEYGKGNVTQAIFLGEDIACLQTLQACSVYPTDYTICIPKHRLHILVGDPPKPATTLKTVSVFVYLGENDRKFEQVFSNLGAVVT